MDESTVQVPPPAATAARRVLVVVLAATTGKKLLEKNIAADTRIKDLRRMVFIQGLGKPAHVKQCQVQLVHGTLSLVDDFCKLGELDFEATLHLAAVISSTFTLRVCNHFDVGEHITRRIKATTLAVTLGHLVRKALLAGLSRFIWNSVEGL